MVQEARLDEIVLHVRKGALANIGDAQLTTKVPELEASSTVLTLELKFNRVVLS